MSSDSDYARKRRKQKANPAPVKPPVIVPPPGPSAARYLLKLPWIGDLSGWEPGLTIATMNPLPAGVYCRASLGKSYVDPVFRFYEKQCEALSIPYGGYHFFVPNDVQSQIDNYLRATIGLPYKEFGPILDMEYTPPRWPFGYRGEQLANQVLYWLKGVEAATHVTPWIYTNLNSWLNLYYDPTGKKNKNNMQAPIWAKDYPLCVAWYPDKPDLYVAPPEYAIPKGFAVQKIWQYAADGRSNGYPMNDLNVWMEEK